MRRSGRRLFGQYGVGQPTECLLCRCCLGTGKRQGQRLNEQCWVPTYLQLHTADLSDIKFEWALGYLLGLPLTLMDGNGFCRCSRDTNIWF